VPDAWFDREALLQARVALDVRDAMRSVARTARVDTARYVVVGVGPTVTMAVEAALVDPRVKALLLVSPAPAPVDRGLVRASLARLHMPVFFQIGPERSTATYRITDVFYRAGNQPASRVVETRMGGTHLAQFQNDPELARRLLAWLDVTLRPPVAPRATRPAPRR
jgi:pimeloyl-ACP methyl ester carboxylesterase